MMADKLELIQEMHRRGILNEQQQEIYNELVNRGVIKQEQKEDDGLIQTGPHEYISVEDVPKMSFVDAVMTGAKNLPASAKNQVMSIVEAAKHPVQTFEGLKALSKDFYKSEMEKAFRSAGFDPEKLEFKEGRGLENITETPVLDAVVDDYKEKYGTYSGFKRALASDPASVMLDVASVVAPTAKGVQAATATKLPAISKTAGAAAKVAGLADPLSAAGAAAKKTIGITSKLTGKAFPKLSPTGLYESATKMSTKIPQAERERLVGVALRENIMPTLDGLNKIENKIETIDKTIADMIDTAQNTGSKMPIGKLFKEFNSLKKERLLSAKPESGIRAIDRVQKEILAANAKIGRGRLTPKEAQKLKQTIYKDLKGAYESMKNSTASVKAQKAVARSAKNYLEELLPEIKMLNKNDSDLIKLRGALEGPASRIRNHQLMGIGAGIKTGAGATVGGMAQGPELAAFLSGLAVAQSVFDHPMVKSKLAIVLNKLQKKGIDIDPNRAIMQLSAQRGSAKAKEIYEENNKE